jgi:hypothetical protein
LNGFEAILEDFSPSTNGNTLLNWNTAYESPGLYYAQPEIILNGVGDDNAVISGVGIIAPYYSSNVVRFFESDSMYDDSSAYLDAQLPVQNASYSISLFDPSTTPSTLISTITNSTSNGMIQEDWGVTNSDGSAFAGSEVDAEFDVTLQDGSGQAIAHASLLKQMAKIVTPERIAANARDGFDFVYFYTPTNNLQAYQFNHGEIDAGMQSVVDVLTQPSWPWDVYYSYFDLFTWAGNTSGYAGYIQSRTSGFGSVLNNLYPDMANGTTKEFFGYGHGSKTGLACYAPTNTVPSVYMASFEVGTVLGNHVVTTGKPKGLIPTDPYRFVFLDGCSTASSPDWRQAFGIMPFWATNQAARYHLGPQAFVGWAGEKSDMLGYEGSVYGNDVPVAYTETLQYLYIEWMNGTPLAQCIADASNTNVVACPLPVPEVKTFKVDGVTYTNTWPSKIYIVGHSGLTINGLNSGFDNLYVSPIDIDKSH